MLLPPPFISAASSGRRLCRWRGLIAMYAGLNCQALLFAATNETAPRLEYQVKAGYLFNFLRFTDWPPQALPAGTPYRIGVMGDTATFNVIAEALRGKDVSDRTIEVVALKPGDSLKGCHLVFVPRTAALSESELNSMEGREGVLMVGESDDYARRGGMIGFVIRGHNIRFQVNLSAAQQAGLKLSGRLASLAEIVQPRSP